MWLPGCCSCRAGRRQAGAWRLVSTRIPVRDDLKEGGYSGRTGPSEQAPLRTWRWSGLGLGVDRDTWRDLSLLEP